MKFTPEEEAIDLIDSFYVNELDQYKAFGKNNYKFAVQSALLCVNKILNVIPKTREWKDSTVLYMLSLGEDPNEYELPESDEIKHYTNVKSILMKKLSQIS